MAQKTGDELTITAVSIVILVLIILFALDNVETIEAFFQDKVRDRHIKY